MPGAHITDSITGISVHREIWYRWEHFGVVVAGPVARKEIGLKDSTAGQFALGLLTGPEFKRVKSCALLDTGVSYPNTQLSSRCLRPVEFLIPPSAGTGLQTSEHSVTGLEAIFARIAAYGGEKAPLAPLVFLPRRKRGGITAMTSSSEVKWACRTRSDNPVAS